LEDLGLSLSEHLQQISVLLRLSPEEYHTKSSGCSPRLVAAVRQMRNITSGWTIYTQAACYGTKFGCLFWYSRMVVFRLEREQLRVQTYLIAAC